MTAERRAELAALFAGVIEIVVGDDPIHVRQMEDWRAEAGRLKALAVRVIAQAALEAEERGLDPVDFTRVLVQRVERATAHAEAEEGERA